MTGIAELATFAAALGSELAARGAAPANALVEGLAGASVRGGAAVVVAAAVSAGARGLAPRAKSWLWWVACLAFLVPPLSGVPGGFAVPVSIPGVGERSAASIGESGAGRESLAAGERGERGEAAREAAAPAASRESRGVPRALPTPAGREAPLASLLAVVWACGAFLCASIGVVRAARARAWAANDGGGLAAADQALALRLAGEAGLAAPPRIVLSRRAPVPLVVSFGAPTIVLPSSTWEALDRTDRALVLAHEIAHVARRDALRSWVPWIADCLFWFHPFARAASCEFAAWREAACDADVLAERRTAAPRYAELLVKLGVAPRLSGAGVGASSEFRTLKRRILMLDRMPRRGGGRVAVCAFLLLATIAVVPVRFLDSSAAAKVGTTSEAAPPAPPAPAAPALDPAAPARAASPAPRVVAAPRAEARPKSSHSTTWSERNGRKGASFLFVDGERSHLVGSAKDAKRLESVARKTKAERFLLVRHAGGTFLLRDDSTLAEVKALLAPVESLAAMQGELGQLQGELGGRQGELGQVQGELGAFQAELAERMARLDRTSRRAAARDDREEIDARAAEREELARRMSKLGERQSELGERQSELGRRQSQVGERQSELGRSQEQASRALSELLAELLEAKIESGTAERVGD